MSQPRQARDDEQEITAMTELQTVSITESMIRGEIDTQVRTAKAYPRSITSFRRFSTQMVQLDQETAEACIYSMPRAGKPLTGPSVRFAEIILSAWGNSRAGYRPVEESDRYVTAQGVFADLENNTAITAEVRRGIVSRKGQRFSDDMINVTMNAAGSIAFRNAVLRGIPQALWLPVYNAAKEVAIGNATTLVARRSKVVDYFGKMGETMERLLYRLEREGIDDISLDDLETLTGLKTAIKEGMPVDVAFPPVGSREQPANGVKNANDLTEKLKAEREQRASDTGERPPAMRSAGDLAEQAINHARERRQGPPNDTPGDTKAEPGELAVSQVNPAQPAGDRSRLLDAFNDLVDKTTPKTARETLEVATGFRSIERVADEQIGQAIEALTKRARQDI
jgi:hypothetical protein